MTSIGDRIRTRREELGLTQQELGEKLGYKSRATVNKIELGQRNLKQSKIKEIADALGTTPAYIMGWDDPKKPIFAPMAPTSEESALIKRYRALDPHGRRMVDMVIDEETRRMAAESAADEEEVESKVIPLFGNSFAAGVPEADFGNMWENYEVPADSKADFAIKINGDSMEPYIPDGSIALGRRAKPKDGDVCALLLDGEFLCKQVCQDCQGNTYLLSLNRARSDADVTIWHDSPRSLACFGVIMLDKPVPLP